MKDKRSTEELKRLFEEVKTRLEISEDSIDRAEYWYLADTLHERGELYKQCSHTVKIRLTKAPEYKCLLTEGHEGAHEIGISNHFSTDHDEYDDGINGVPI